MFKERHRESSGRALFAPSTAEIKTILSNRTIDIAENVGLTLKGHTSHCEVAPLEGLQYINVELSLLGKKTTRLQADKWWDNRKELTMVRTICNHV